MFQSTLPYGEWHNKTGDYLVNSGCNWTTKCLVVDFMWCLVVNEERNAAIYLLRQLTGSKLREIGTEFGISSYSTVSTIIERTRNEVPKNRRLRKRIEQLRPKLVLSQETP